MDSRYRKKLNELFKVIMDNMGSSIRNGSLLNMTHEGTDISLVKGSYRLRSICVTRGDKASFQTDVDSFTRLQKRLLRYAFDNRINELKHQETMKLQRAKADTLDRLIF